MAGIFFVKGNKHAGDFCKNLPQAKPKRAAFFQNATSEQRRLSVPLSGKVNVAGSVLSRLYRRMSKEVDRCKRIGLFWLYDSGGKIESMRKEKQREKQMAEIVKVYKEKVPAMRFIGKKYDDFGHWGDWFANGWFDIIENAMGGVDSIRQLWKDGGAYVGLERRKDDEPFAYWIGMFAQPGIQVPGGFYFIDFPETFLGVCWIYGEEGATHGMTGACAQKLADEGIEIVPDQDGAVWSFENCTCPRFTTPDEKGNVILDYCYFVK